MFFVVGIIIIKKIFYFEFLSFLQVYALEIQA